MDPSLETGDRRNDCVSSILFVLVSGWMLAIGLARVVIHQGLSVSPDAYPRAGVILAAGQALLLAVPLLPLAIFWRAPRYRPVFQTWALAGLFGVVLLPAQLPDPTAAQVQAGLHILQSFIYLFLLLLLAAWISRRLPAEAGGPPRNVAARTSLAASLLLAALSALPWLAWGALGSPLDTLLQLGAALFFGLAGGLLLERFLFQPLSASPTGSWREFLLQGWTTSIALWTLAAGTAFAFGAMQLLLMIVLAAFGPALAGLRLLARPQTGQMGTAGLSAWVGRFPDRRGWMFAALFIALLAAPPMALIDPDELLLIISAAPGEILGWAFSAASTSALIGLGAGALLFIVSLVVRRSAQTDFEQLAEAESPALARILVPILVLAALLAWGGAGWVYLTAGQPGFYGERLFVILKDQADVSSVASIEDDFARRMTIYRTLVDHATATQADLRAGLDRFGLAYTPYYLVNGIEVRGDPFLRLWLSARPEVDRVLDSPRMRPLAEPPPISTGSAGAPTKPDWNLTLIGADRVWQELGVTGEGILIGQSDSGVQGDHPQLAAHYRGREVGDDYNWLDPWNGSPSPVDIGGHGTHTLGSILGQQTGVAPGAEWLGCVNLARNLGNPAFYLDCMQFMLAPFPQGGDPFQDGDPSLGAHVINNSWGCPETEGCDPASLQPAVAALRAAGVFVVVSAGNDGPDCESLNTPPALYDEAYSVGAVDRSGQLAGFSSRGPVTEDGSGRVKPDIVAPGVEVLSAYPGSTYSVTSGTSMAGPHLAGVVALIWSANPGLIGEIDRTEAILNETAQPFTGSLPDCPGAESSPSTAVGYGLVDAYAAVRRAIEIGP